MKNDFRRIGPVLLLNAAETPTMQAAYDTDLECGSHHLANLKSKHLDRDFPTICAMAELIEKERNQYKQEVVRLKKLISRTGSQHTRNRQTDEAQKTKEVRQDVGAARRSIRA